MKIMNNERIPYFSFQEKIGSDQITLKYTWPKKQNYNFFFLFLIFLAIKMIFDSVNKVFLGKLPNQSHTPLYLLRTCNDSFKRGQTLLTNFLDILKQLLSFSGKRHDKTLKLSKVVLL